LLGAAVMLNGRSSCARAEQSKNHASQASFCQQYRRA
jgi:hypothetical protein